MKKAGFPFIVLFTSICNFLLAQEFNTFLLSEKTWNRADSNNLILEIDNVNFFKNNELMGDFKQGYTVPGYNLRPRLTYYPGKHTRISAGMHMVNLFGEMEYYEVRPTFSIQHEFLSNLFLVMGELHGNLNHGLIDPIYDFDRYFFDNMEQGLQLLYFSKFLTADLWLDWENFIFWEDPSQEEGTLGFSGEVHLIQDSQSWGLDIPLQGIICHRGGQINSTDMPNKSQTDLSPGLQISYFPGTFVKCLSFNGRYVYYNNFSGSYTENFKEGYGIFPTLTVNTRLFEYQAAYWHAYKYYGPRGDALYFSVSSYNNTIAFSRDIIANKIGVNKHFDDGISAALFLETFYDLNEGNMEYNYSIYLRFNQAFFLKKLKPMGRNKN
ncbi:MAG: hypothetical protein JXB49_35725 [Bacteroidales bacterium]|nr:hypothetical protein [Bacteroidales bacterium]